ncbi:hypothetical protein LEP1GSC163_4312 [Leptospira santarosai str. CBC379]|uniref:Uncharacterized protein n=1 Tax=Leptospira santarosai str. MOR084 TaxID=1049984 RepID=A0A0E2BB22_9LEPT|nr:hypothetical protein LEP1GSC179_0059 [Leptospira santarosai str. MOR084]EKR91105.1 hypothetical protein LEP1GSC163_4312 [Leptospira santarosai str. CBC379]
MKSTTIKSRAKAGIKLGSRTSMLKLEDSLYWIFQFPFLPMNL